MATEEKAKAYDEALGRAKSLFGNCPIGSERAKICSIIFPQLAESEDERVRKSIIHILQVGGYMSPEEKEKAFAYLEKQKVNTEGDFGRGYDCGYEACLHSHGAEWFEKQKEQTEIPLMNGDADLYFDNWIQHWNQQKQNPTKHHCFDEGIKYAQRLQEEQKPAERSLEDDHIIGFVYDLLNEIEWKDDWAMSKEECLRLLSNYIPQKSAEKQDYSGLNNLERAILRGFLAAGVENIPVTAVKETAKECLAQMKPAEWSDTNELVFKDICKHLKEEGYNGWVVLLKALRNGEFQPKEEWSEEDEEIFNNIIEKAKGGHWIEVNEITWLITRFKSLRPSWKSSEEQKEALEYVIRDYREDGCNATANYLQEVLDHLKNM